MATQSNLFVVESAQNVGRYTVATEDLELGKTVLLDPPLVAVVDDAHLDTLCAVCFQPASSKCGQCKIARYCSNACQKSDWKMHKRECLGYKKVGRKPPAVVRLASRLWMLNQVNPERYARMKSLQSHRDEYSGETLQSFTEMAILVLSFTSDDEITLAKLSSPAVQAVIEEVVCIFCVIMTNAYAPWNDELESVGVGLYPILSLMNHACDANCAPMYINGTTAHVRTLRPIKKGEELTISYLDVTAQTESRKKSIKDQWLFDCKCRRCVEQVGQSDPLGQISREIMDLGTKAEMLMQMMAETKDEDLRDIDKYFLANLDKVLGPNHEMRLKYLRFMQDALLHTQNNDEGDKRWRRTLVIARKVLPIEEAIFGKVHPRVSHQKLMVAELAAYCCKNVEDYQKDKRLAVEALKITHGAQNQLTLKAMSL
ncbi:hypothetical protein BJ742DRAFT_241191 [Cladochytrium replicatum]|nr:hypothetical protein BJ742DRAFT_241191 [Cladochytrium replicatum]